MEYAQKYWYIIGGVLVLLFFVSRKSSSAVNVSGGGDALGMAQIASAEREADESRRFGLFSSLLNYDLASRTLSSETELARIGLGQQIQLAEIAAEAQTQSAENQYQLAQLMANLQNSQYQSQYNLQRYVADRTFNQQRRNDWLGALGIGLQTILPNIFGRSTSSGGYGFPNTAPTFPSGGGFGIRIGF